ncbi:hypothetical protein XNC1_1317 [Xenorhabdus nematophila ATCC 19061]|uniref:Uncharacterized protein n=1 Tax=Xenorhabdus nematophila (strain ATCC 19061 / DSM 3370 / CCUG 14189 / LMG 1036 / NCIMB 9965 / AN6) TaxID=406817 RepID=D3VAE6_XENNA|nr:hypothetical protein XNC1_1317 [Xenorhabdus nematophila ATCC 19061]CEE94506.1 hypothetical protein XNA1_4690015 [Xenorhabdus nematophila str. Anatoliense]CEE95506.1 hypothetical protein XNA1_530015 [Xenorhabdus nematophila str. Anatoliense]CEK22278.1 hypothetical protein XNC2_1284 [Xenorhabdus nematophila AN6/1]
MMLTILIYCFVDILNLIMDKSIYTVFKYSLLKILINQFLILT